MVFWDCLVCAGAHNKVEDVCIISLKSEVINQTDRDSGVCCKGNQYSDQRQTESASDLKRARQQRLETHRSFSLSLSLTCPKQNINSCEQILVNNSISVSTQPVVTMHFVPVILFNTINHKLLQLVLSVIQVQKFT